jgi:8-oxo-dGTP pyrophosphatase MutT (NUDIX family)
MCVKYKVKENINENNMNMNENRFLKLITNNDKLNDEYIHFKKRNSYSYNNYKNFFNNKSITYNKIQNNYVNVDYNIKDKCTYSSNNYINYTKNNILESINYPELNITIIDNEINDSNDSNNSNNSNNSNKLEYKIDSDNLNSNKLEDKINKPITSYGIVLYTYEKNKYLKYLVCQRRDSISYIQYLQDLIDENNILKYINLMSKEEKERCLEYYYKKDPHSIWKDLWINHNSKIYKTEYNRCTDIFLKNMEKYLHYFKDETIGQKENQWCFPKGRIHENETEINCALREFEEETGISSESINVNKNIKFEELYIGSNNLIYKTVYYVAFIPFIPKKIYRYYPFNIRKKFISSEFYDMEWLEYQLAYEKLNKSKQDILEKINNYILKRSFKK